MAKKPIEVETLTHDGVGRKNIPTAEYESVMAASEKSPIRLAYERRNRDLDPQLVWRGKDEQDWSDLIVSAPPLYIQEKVHPKAIIDDLQRETRRRKAESGPAMPDLFGDFNGLPIEARTEFYAHNQHWSNRMISGDSLSVMASLAEREGLRGQVQCIYFDPPYGIRFNSNFQWSTTSPAPKDGARDSMTREPEQVRAFRDTWRDEIHSYLTYLRDRLTVARDLLKEGGSLFVQIGEENVHRVRSLMDEVFGPDNFVSQISFVKAGALGASGLPRRLDYLLWYARNAKSLKFRRFLVPKSTEELGQYTSIVQDDYSLRSLTPEERRDPSTVASDRLCRLVSFTKPGPGARYPLVYEGKSFSPGNRWWGFPEESAYKIARAGRLRRQGNSIASLRYWNDFAAEELTNLWADTASGSGMDKVYVVQTNVEVIKRCLLMTTDPGDLVLDPTCGSGSTAYVAEQWGRRWITIDTSRVAVALARSRLMGARYPYYLLADSPEGQSKEADVTRSAPKSAPTHRDVRHGFVYERVPHITLKSITENTEIDVIWQNWQNQLEPLRVRLNVALGESWEEWEIPRVADDSWPVQAKDQHRKWWDARVGCQKEIDASIAAKAEFEFLYDKPYVDNSRTRVAGPFTVESLSPHRTLAVDWDDELIDLLDAAERKREPSQGIDRDEAISDFAQMILENLKSAGVQQAHKEDRIGFTSLVGWPGNFVCAEGRFMEGDSERRAGIFIGPQFGTVSRPDLVAAAKECGDAGFDVLVACAFNFDAHSSEFTKLGRVPVLKARMNPDLHMGGDLKATGAGNLFVVFGEPDIRIHDQGDGTITVQVFGVDVFKPQTGEVVSEDTDGIALWMLDTDYNEESFFVRHAYFLGANDPYKALRNTLKAEIDEEAWSSLNSDTSRPFPKPESKRIAVKVINHLGDEVMKVFRVD